MGKKSLAEQIAELNKPRSEFDIEDNDLRENVFEHEDNSDNEAVSSDEEMKKEHYVAVNKSKLRQNELDLGSKYTGSVSSRKDLYDDDEEMNQEEDDQDEEDEEDESEDNSEDDAVDLDNSDLDDIDSEDEDSEEQDSDDNTPEEDESLTHKRDKLKELLQQERKHIVSRLSLSASGDALKGYTVLQQHKFFDSVLDARIKLQKSIAASNILPPNAATIKAEQLSTKKSDKYLSRAQDKCFDLLDSIFALRNTLLKKDSITTSTPPKAPKKRTLSAYLEASSQQDDLLNKYRSAVLTKWSAKIQTSSGSNALNAGKFKAINQSSEQQVANNLSDMDRLVKRTKLNRRLITPLGYAHYVKEEKKRRGESDDEDVEIEAEEDADIPKTANENKSSIAEIDEIFDDEDFYRVLLNDLVDKKVQSSNPTSGMAITLASAQRLQKLKKNVDTKASKGRKLRYHIQEPIANFEAPGNGWKWQDDQIDEFFASLLGQKVNMAEDDDEEETHSDEEIAADGIKLFG